MQDFFNKIYGIENFTTYILIAVSVLLILFLLILFLGKKDQKLEETKRLEKLSEDAFKEESQAVKVEIAKENVDILIPPNQNNHEPVEIKEEPLIIPEEPINMTTEEPVMPVLEEISEEPLNVPEEVNVLEIEPLKAEEENNYNKEEITIPEFNFDDLTMTFNDEQKEENSPIKLEETVKKNESTPIFSSVYINKKEEEPVIIKIAEPIANPIKIEEEEPQVEKEVEEEEFELPKLKEEKEQENSSPSLDSITGETYNINK